jgi:hypothetical protein
VRDDVLDSFEPFHRPDCVEENHAREFDLGVRVHDAESVPAGDKNVAWLPVPCSVRNAGGSAASPFRSMSRKRCMEATELLHKTLPLGRPAEGAGADPNAMALTPEPAPSSSL